MGQYEYIIDKNHHRKNEENQVYVHIIEAEKILGRQLLPEEIVHHKDLNKQNNDPNNLMIFATKADHTSFHGQGCNIDNLIKNPNGTYSCKKKKYECIDCGAIISSGAIRCKKCSKSFVCNKSNKPSKEALFKYLKENRGNFTKVASIYNVTDNAIRKWCIKYNIPAHSKDYK